MVRAKFRVMGLHKQWNGKVTTVSLLPVIAKAPEGQGFYVDPEGSVENAAFWDATPSGEAELVFRGFDAPFEIGKCVYIDMQQLDVEPSKEEAKSHWKLESVKNSYCLSIALRIGWVDADMTRGVITMDIANEGAWPPFQGKHLTHWSVTLTPAEG